MQNKRIIIELNECDNCLRALYIYLTGVLRFHLKSGKLKGEVFEEIWGSSTPLQMKNTKFPHEFDELAKSTNHTIEDDIKFSAELGRRKHPAEKWIRYKQMVYWVSFCDRMGININNKEEVYETLKELWDDVKESDLYKKPCKKCELKEGKMGQEEFIKEKIEEIKKDPDGAKKVGFILNNMDKFLPMMETIEQIYIKKYKVTKVISEFSKEHPDVCFEILKRLELENVK